MVGTCTISTVVILKALATLTLIYRRVCLRAGVTPGGSTGLPAISRFVPTTHCPQLVLCDDLRMIPMTKLLLI